MFGAKTKGNTQPPAVECFPNMVYNQCERTLQNTPPTAKLLIFNILQKYINLSDFVFRKDTTKIINF